MSGEFNGFSLMNEMTGLNLLPFYKEYDEDKKENFFKISKDELFKKSKYYLEKSLEYLDVFAETYGFSIEVTKDNFFETCFYDYYDNEEMESAENIFKPKLKIIIKFQEMINGLLELKIPEDELNDYIKRKQSGKNIKKYNQLKDEFRYAIHEYVVVKGTDYINYDLNDFKTNSGENVILNHNNPFADVSIENQQYLYPTNDKKFKTLSFNIGYIMDKQTTNNNESIVLTPNFKIKNTYDRDNFNIDINMSDAITSPIKKTEKDKEILYI